MWSVFACSVVCLFWVLTCSRYLYPCSYKDSGAGQVKCTIRPGPVKTNRCTSRWSLSSSPLLLTDWSRVHLRLKTKVQGPHFSYTLDSDKFQIKTTCTPWVATVRSIKNLNHAWIGKTSFNYYVRSMKLFMSRYIVQPFQIIDYFNHFRYITFTIYASRYGFI